MKAAGPGLTGRRRAACMCTLEPMNIPATDCLPARRPMPRAYLTGPPRAAPTNFLRKAPFAIQIVQRAARISKRVGENTGTVCEPRTARLRDRPVPCSASVVRPRTSKVYFGACTWRHLDGPTNASSVGTYCAVRRSIVAGYVALVLQPRCVCELSFGGPSWPRRRPVSEGNCARVNGAACVRASSGLTARLRGWC